MKLLRPALLLCSLCFSVGASHAASLTLPDLVNHPERWPQSVTLLRNFNFEGGASARKGQKVTVLDVTSNKVKLGTGDLIFSAAPQDCNLLSAANQTWNALTPAQQAITPTKLQQDLSLWPAQIKMARTVEFKSGGRLPQGEKVDFISLAQDGVHLYSERLSFGAILDVQDTDLIAQARQRVLLPTNQRPSRIASTLKGKLVDANGNRDNSDLEDVRVFALYYGASWCGPCRKFTPGFISYINQVTAQNPHLRVVMMSNDEKPEDMLGYMQEEKMPWSALPLASLNKSPILSSYPGNTIPKLMIVDRNGKLLAGTYQGETYLGSDAALQALKKLVESGAAR